MRTGITSLCSDLRSKGKPQSDAKKPKGSISVVDDDSDVEKRKKKPSKAITVVNVEDDNVSDTESNKKCKKPAVSDDSD